LLKNPSHTFVCVISDDLSLVQTALQGVEPKVFGLLSIYKTTSTHEQENFTYLHHLKIFSTAQPSLTSQMDVSNGSEILGKSIATYFSIDRVVKSGFHLEVSDKNSPSIMI
jgi:hypothetical protein